MTPYDVGMIALLVGGMIWGAWRGITWQLASLASLVLGYVVAFPLSAQIAPHFPGEPLLARGVALLVSYVGVSLGVFLIAWSIRATLRKLRFEAYDRHLGMILGGLEGLVLGLVVTIVVLSVAPGTRDTILGSPSGKLVDRVFLAARPVIPAELRARLDPVWHVLDDEESGASRSTVARRDSDVEEAPLSDELERRGEEAGRRVGERIGRALGLAGEDTDGRSGTTRRW